MQFLAYFLPGFHRDSFNDEWWGKGFTEWENIKGACPLYKDHFQPNLPLDGMFNLLDPPVLEANYRDAASAGIDAFVVYDYWYEGRRPLGSIIDLVCHNKEIDFRFSVCWGNHSWTRSWKNRSGALDVLIEQRYPMGTDLDEQIDYYLKLFSDSRYFRLEGRPLFMIYRPLDIPQLAEFCERFRERCIKSGMNNPYLVGQFSGAGDYGLLLKCMDAITLSNPTVALFAADNPFQAVTGARRFMASIHNPRLLSTEWKRILYFFADHFPPKYKVFDYNDVLNRLLKQSRNAKSLLGDKMLFSSFCGFDNTPRYRNRAIIVENVCSKKFIENVRQLHDLNPGAKCFFVNAWNEWGEGMSMQPSVKYGHSFTSALRDFVNEI